eukprot:2194757-Rhodomonas_salina.1
MSSSSVDTCLRLVCLSTTAKHGICVGVERGAETGGLRAAVPSAQDRKSAETQVARGSGAASGSCSSCSSSSSSLLAPTSASASAAK